MDPPDHWRLDSNLNEITFNLQKSVILSITGTDTRARVRNNEAAGGKG